MIWRMDHNQMGAWITAEMMSGRYFDLPDSGTSLRAADHSSMAGMDHSRMAECRVCKVILRPKQRITHWLIIRAMSVSPRQNDPEPAVFEITEEGSHVRGFENAFEDLTDVNTAIP